MNILVGTAGFSYKDWDGIVYPADHGCRIMIGILNQDTWDFAAAGDLAEVRWSDTF